jgi:hypothetical protein
LRVALRHDYEYRAAYENYSRDALAPAAIKVRTMNDRTDMLGPPEPILEDIAM